MSIWRLQGTAYQNLIVQNALDSCDFPFDRMRDNLRAKLAHDYRINRDYIPVEWQDLSRYSIDSSTPVETVLVRGHQAHRGHGDAKEEEFDVIKVRNRVLGLAWYSGKVTLDTTLQNNRSLAMEVFLSEGAHMVDFFDPVFEANRARIYNAFHPDHQDIDPNTDIQDGVDYGHGHGWFDVGGYYSWAGEAFMGGFIKAFAPSVPVTIHFHHSATSEVGAEIRKVLLPPEPEPEPEPKPPAKPVFAFKTPFKIYHDQHRFAWLDRLIKVKVWFNSPEEAREAGLRACRVCKPDREE